MKCGALCGKCKMNSSCKGFVEKGDGGPFTLYHCPGFITDDGKPLTNYEKIRTMSLEELAIFITQFSVCSQCPQMGKQPCDCKDSLLNSRLKIATGILEWLQKEVEQ